MKEESLLTKSINSFEKKFIVEDRIYPRYSLWTAVTGRSSSSDPNGQNRPVRGKAAKEYGRMFKADEGKVILSADLSQAELRIAADMANERTMIEIYRNDGDVHASTAAAVIGELFDKFMGHMDDDTPLHEVVEDWGGARQYLQSISQEERSKVTVSDFLGLKRYHAKAVDFGYIFGMWWKKFMAYAKTQYGVEFTPKESESAYKAFFNKYSGLNSWHDKTRSFVRSHGYVRSYSGRIRHLPTIHSTDEWVAKEAERQAINAPVQEFASSWGLMAMADIDANVDSYYLQLRGFIHDALYAQVRLEHILWGASVMKHYMENVPVSERLGLRMKVPMKSDVAFGLNESDKVEMKGFDMSKAYDLRSLKGLDFEIPDQEVPPGHVAFCIME
jgi:DNA polymerase I-like protein with 3'-5' exonuclease and polymerase domains